MSLGAWLAILIVAVVAIAMRAIGSRRSEQVTYPDPAMADVPDADEVADDEPAGDEAVALTSDGWAFVPHRETVELVPPAEPGEEFDPLSGAREPGVEAYKAAGRGRAPVDPRTGRPVPERRPSDRLSPGDLIAARVVRGAPDLDPWRLEVLRRDRDYHAWPFETEAAAREALAMVERRVVRPPRDRHGDPETIEPQDFEKARREHEEIEAELATMPFADEDPGSKT